MPSIEGQDVSFEVKPLDSLAVRLARAGVLVAVLVGIILSGFQVYIDYGRQDQLLNRQIEELIKVAEKPATRAIFILDYALAEQVVHSLLVYNFVVGVTILDENRQVMAEDTKPLKEVKESIFNDFIEGQTVLEKELPPTIPGVRGTGVGYLVLTISRGEAFSGFMERAVVVFIVGIFRNILLSLILLFIFHKMVTKPLSELVDSLREVDLAKPETQKIYPPSGHDHDELGAIANTGSLFVAEVFSQISSRENTERQLAQAQKMESLGQMTGGLAHDFNNLLTIMLGNVEFLEFDFGDDERAKENITPIKEAVERASSLTNRLLAFSRLQTLAPKTIDIAQLIFNLEDLFRRTLGETITLKIKHSPGLWNILVDQHQLDNALINLAINARDAMSDGGILSFETSNVTLDKHYVERHADLNEGDYVRISVSDNGTGMPTEVVKKVFDPFFTTKKFGQGSGLGLSMVYGFVKQSNGHIAISSEPGNGTAVNLYLPRSFESIDLQISISTRPEFTRGFERILIVEDDCEVRKIPVGILRAQGYQITEAENGEEAICRLGETSDFDLIFTDVVLPGSMNGIEIAEQAKLLQPNIKVLYTTGYAKNLVHEFQEDSDKFIVTKPYSRNDLLSKVRDLLGQ